MNRYLVFAGREYDPSGGWFDFESDHGTEQAARVAAERVLSDKSKWSYEDAWAHVIDLETGRPVACFSHDSMKRIGSIEAPHELEHWLSTKAEMADAELRALCRAGADVFVERYDAALETLAKGEAKRSDG